LNESANANVSAGQSLCLECGLCCNGVIFADVTLQPGDNAAALRKLGLPISTGRRLSRFTQPCAALDGCRCCIYPDRPKYCREFECLVLRRVQAGRISYDEARKVIQTARARSEKVKRLLRALGDEEETLSLGARFRRTAKRLERVGLDEETADLYGQLTLAVHDLNLLISDSFYAFPAD
jgi:Fe-S-cluster containining protein